MSFYRPGIYKIESRDGKVYVGSAVSISARWASHRKDLNKQRHHSKHLQRSWNKYGADHFTFSVIEFVDDKSKLLHYEQIWLNILFDSLDIHDIYNENRVAGSSLGRKLTPEQRQKHGDIRRGKPFTEEHRNALAGQYRLVSPQGVITDIVNLRAFSRSMGHPHSPFSRLLAGKIKSAYGWTRVNEDST